MREDPRDFLLRRPWRAVDLPQEVEQVPTMLTRDERALLYVLARDYAGGDAAVVDGGCFLGGSTVAVLAGLRDREEPWRGPPLATYDRFRVEEYTVPLFFADTGLQGGESFRKLFDANVGGFAIPHVVHEGDVIEAGWTGEPIDVLFLDLVKSWKINDAVLRDFFPSLVPGRSVIVHQDYGWGGMPWIPIGVELVRDSLGLFDRMPGGTHVFFVERPLPQDVLTGGLRHLDLEAQIELVERAVVHANGWTRGMLEITHGTMVAQRDGVERGLRELDGIEARYAGDAFVQSCLAYVRDGLLTGWSQAGARHFGRLAESERPVS
jgi:hypothetical protein